jgi:hypothetical protein
VLSTNTWYHLEFKATIHNTTGVIQLKIDGTDWIASTGSLNTRGQTSNNYINGFTIGSSALVVPYTRWDDVYFLDTTGSAANDFIGPQKIITIFPNGAGNSSDWTGNYASNFANVNETGGDGDEIFNQSATAGDIDLFTFDDIPPGTITAIQHTIMARQDSGAVRTFRPKIRIGGTNYNGTTVNLPGSHLFLTEPVMLNPADSAAWEASDINAAEFGYELVS